MTGLSEFLDMGGYGHFIWPSYALVAVVMVGLLIISRRELGTALRDLDALDAPEAPEAEQ